MFIFRWTEQDVSGGIVTCSALKHSYRQILKHGMCCTDANSCSVTTGHCSHTMSMFTSKTLE